MPFWRPWERDIVDTERFHLGGQPGKDSDDENHGEHHGFHGAHLHFQLLRHHLLLKCHGLLLQDGVPGETRFVHHLTDLPLTMADVGLVHGVNEKVPNHGVQCHRKDTEDHDRDDEKGFLGQQGRKQRVSRCSQGCPDGRRHDEDGHENHEHQHDKHGRAPRRGRWRRRGTVGHDGPATTEGHEG